MNMQAQIKAAAQRIQGAGVIIRADENAMTLYIDASALVDVVDTRVFSLEGEAAANLLCEARAYTEGDVSFEEAVASQVDAYLDDYRARPAHLEQAPTDDAIAIALDALGEDATAERIREIREEISVAGSAATTTGASLQDRVSAARTAASEKTFEVGGVQFAAVRHNLPRPHWRLRVQESGEEYEPGAGGISTESVPKMRANIEEMFQRVSKGDLVDFRARFNLPEPGASADAITLAGAFQAVYFSGKRIPSNTADLEACWGVDAVAAIERHIEGGPSQLAGTSAAGEERLLADTLQDVWKAVESGSPYSRQVLRGPEFADARTAAARFAPDWKKCVASYEARYRQLGQSAAADLGL
jgi:hypothetical protein